jgi:hypothetical protein
MAAKAPKGPMSAYTSNRFSGILDVFFFAAFLSWK